MAKKKQVMNWKKWSVKLVKNLGIVMVAGLAVVYGDSAWYLAIVPAILQLENYLKHK